MLSRAGLWTFKRRYGAVGEMIAEVLPRFSLDVIRVVAGYAMYGVASAGAQARNLYVFGTAHAADERLASISDMACNPSDGRIWITDDLSRVQVFDNEGNFLFRAAVNVAFPRGVAFDSDQSEVYIATEVGHEIVVCGFDGGYRRHFAPAFVKTISPYRLALVGDCIWIVDAMSALVHVLKRDGTPARQSVVTSGFSNIHSKPQAVEMSPDSGEVFVLNGWRSRIQVFDSLGRFQRDFGVAGFDALCDMAFDREGQLCIVNHSGARIVKQQGTIVASIGPFAYSSRLCVCVDLEGRILIGLGDKVGVYGFDL